MLVSRNLIAEEGSPAEFYKVLVCINHCVCCHRVGWFPTFVPQLVATKRISRLEGQDADCIIQKFSLFAPIEQTIAPHIYAKLDSTCSDEVKTERCMWSSRDELTTCAIFFLRGVEASRWVPPMGG